jgi:hypothetical protein
MNRGSTNINYLILLLVVLLGVAGGNLLSDWVGVQIAAYRGEHAAPKPAKSGRAGAGQAPETGSAKLPMPGDLLHMAQEKIREQRRLDRDGVRLSRACEEWRKANAQLHSYTTDIEMKKHCGIYDRYVQDGVLPGKK